MLLSLHYCYFLLLLFLYNCTILSAFFSPANLMRKWLSAAIARSTTILTHICMHISSHLATFSCLATSSLSTCSWQWQRHFLHAITRGDTTQRRSISSIEFACCSHFPHKNKNYTKKQHIFWFKNFSLVSVRVLHVQNPLKSKLHLNIFVFFKFFSKRTQFAQC